MITPSEIERIANLLHEAIVRATNELKETDPASPLWEMELVGRDRIHLAWAHITDMMQSEAYRSETHRVRKPQ